jgi:hypothetical protein
MDLLRERTIWIVDAQRGDGETRFVVRADELLTAVCGTAKGDIVGGCDVSRIRYGCLEHRPV